MKFPSVYTQCHSMYSWMTIKSMSISISVSVCRCVCACVCARATHHTEHQSYLDEWFAQSFLVYLQHNVPDLFIRQAERAQENCCCDIERRESFPFLFFFSPFFYFYIRLQGSKRHFSTHCLSDKMTTDLTCHLEKLMHFLPPHQDGLCYRGRKTSRFTNESCTNNTILDQLLIKGCTTPKIINTKLLVVVVMESSGKAFGGCIESALGESLAGASRCRWGGYGGNWSWWRIQVEVTGGGLVMSWRRVAQQLLYYWNSWTWCLYLMCNREAVHSFLL